MAIDDSSHRQIAKEQVTGAMSTFCPKCGAEQATDSRFCAKCGADQQAATVQPSDDTAPQRASPWFLGGVGLIAALLLLIFFQLLSVTRSEEASTDAAAAAKETPKSKFEGYVDKFLSEEVTVVTVRASNIRAYPAPDAEIIGKQYPPDTTLKGRWVESVNTGTKWLKVTESGLYVYDENLADPTSAAANNINLQSYSGKYPTDKVGTTTFIDDPKVRAMVLRAVSDRAFLGEIDSRRGPTTPIVVSGDRLIASGCEQHNCADFNWAIVITGSGVGSMQNARYCRHDYSQMGENSEWFENGRFKVRLAGSCPTDFSGNM